MRPHRPDALPDPVGGLRDPAAHADGVVEHGREGQVPRAALARRQLENDTLEEKGKKGFPFRVYCMGAVHTDM